jgi:hypothetical protein
MWYRNNSEFPRPSTSSLSTPVNLFPVGGVYENLVESLQDRRPETEPGSVATV